MGWCESLPFFCAASETAQDVIQQLLQIDYLPRHPLEHHMLPDDNVHLPTEALDLATTLDLIEVFVDDFIRCTDNLTRSHLVKFTRTMMHGIPASIHPQASRVTQEVIPFRKRN